MKELLTESAFKLSKNERGNHVLEIYQQCHDGLCRVGSITQKIELSDYGIDALEKNLKALLLVILNYSYPEISEMRKHITKSKM
jgi:hypothetical protein